MFAEIILPVPLPRVFTYRIPDGMKAEQGMRAEVPLGKRIVYKGMILRTFSEDPGVKGMRDILSLPDPRPIVSDVQLKFWEWLADYYMCTIGEVYRTALPRGLKESFSPKYVTHTGIATIFRGEDALNELMDGLSRAPKQLLILQRLVEMLMEGGGLGSGVPKSTLSAGMDFSISAYNGLLRKKILSEYSEQAVRSPGEGRKTTAANKLTKSQQKAIHEIRDLFLQKPVVLLKGVTSSGKTEIYIHLIQEVLKSNRQVLYLLPEIALTTQIIERLKEVFGDEVGIYHSKYSDAERVETFLRARENPLGREYRIILGARSALFLPFRDLGLVIIDEEYEQTYKQADPAPRYHARDAAIVLAELHSARVLLGSATPSFESYYNTRSGKYGIVELSGRYGDIQQPEIILADLREAYRKKRMVSHFTPELFSLMESTLDENRQLILFQNRRGFSPYIECFHCGWIPGCRHCDVSLVYHKQGNSLVCHYCGHSEDVPGECPDCGEGHMVTRGFGTEKLEEELEVLFPDSSIVRMDLDTTRSRRKYEKIIRDFESGNTQILVGTQIVTKGLDFDNVGLVGVLNADNLLNFPDFRSYERSYQLISQVAGRAGRKDRRGKVVIQTSHPEHPVMQHILNNDYHSMYMGQMEDRIGFHYPPYYRLLRITLRHVDKNLLDKAAGNLTGKLRTGLTNTAISRADQAGPQAVQAESRSDQAGPRAVQAEFRSDQARPLKVQAEFQAEFQADQAGSWTGPLPEVLGPQSPLVARVQQMHLMTILVKLPRTPQISDFKAIIGGAIDDTRSDKQYGKLFIIPDVDPY